jgi:hypothetical protein
MIATAALRQTRRVANIQVTERSRRRRRVNEDTLMVGASASLSHLSVCKYERFYVHTAMV